jgi:hypothetical protein
MRRFCGIFVDVTEEEALGTVLGTGDSCSANAKAYANGRYLQDIPTSICER